MPPSTNGNNIDAINRSVTKDDFSKTPYSRGGSILNIVVPTYTPQGSDLPGYPSMLRDRYLRLTPLKEAMWADAVHIAITKISTWHWQVEGRRTRYWQELILSADGNRGLTAFRMKQAKDWLLTDNGCFREYIHATQGGGTRVIGVAHLPSWRCYRTNDRDIPALYYDRLGRIHEMHDYQVGYASDEPDPDFYDIGLCAASRAYPAIQKLSALEIYVYEKVSGKKAHRIYFVNANMSDVQIQDAIDTQTEEGNRKGYVMYQDAVIMSILNPESAPAVAHIDLAGLPEDYDPDKERIEAKLTYANSLGLDPVELDPNLAARGRALGSGSQAQVLDDKAEGKGIVLFREQELELWNRNVLPNTVTYSTYISDLADDARRATIRKENAEAARALVGNGQAPPILTPTQAQNWLADIGEIPSAYVASDLTTDETLRSDDKPDLVLDAPHNPPPDAALMLTEPSQPAAPSFPPTNAKETLEYRLAEKAYLTELNAANDWAWGIFEKETELFADDELIQMYRMAQHEQYGTLVERTTVAEPVKEKEVQVVSPVPQQPNIIVVTPQSQPQPITVQLQQKETPASTINMPAQSFVIQLPEQPAPTVNVQVQPADVVNQVPVPEVNVNVPTPNVKVVNQVPKQSAPIVNVTNEPPVNNVSVNTEPHDETLDIERDGEGLITRVIKRITG